MNNLRLRFVLQARNFNRPAREILADLIETAAGYRCSLAHTKFGRARKLDPRVDLEYDANSYIPVEIDESYDASFPGDNGFAYYRIPISWLLDGRTVTVTQGQSFKTHDVLEQINEQLGSQLTVYDVVNTEYAGGEDVEITLRAHPGSWVWCQDPAPVFEAFDLSWLSARVLARMTYTPPASEPLTAAVSIADAVLEVTA